MKYVVKTNALISCYCKADLRFCFCIMQKAGFPMVRLVTIQGVQLFFWCVGEGGGQLDFFFPHIMINYSCIDLASCDRVHDMETVYCVTAPGSAKLQMQFSEHYSYLRRFSTYCFIEIIGGEIQPPYQALGHRKLHFNLTKNENDKVKKICCTLCHGSLDFIEHITKTRHMDLSGSSIMNTVALWWKHKFTYKHNKKEEKKMMYTVLEQTKLKHT